MKQIIRKIKKGVKLFFIRFWVRSNFG